MVDYSQWLALGSLYLSYVMHTYSRRSFQNVINYIIKEKYLTEDIIGIVITSQQVGYTMSKFVQPFFLDKVNPRIFLVMTMIISFFCTLSMSYSTTPFGLTAFYSLHGFGLAFAWPSVAKILKSTIADEEFGFWWSILCTSSNVGAIFGSMISTLISDNFGWRKNLRFSAVVNLSSGLVVALIFLLCTVKSRPLTKTETMTRNSNLKFADILLNPILMVNAIMIFSVYVTRYVISDWYQIHLSSLEFPQMTIASFISMMEIGGIVGTVLAGISADYFFVYWHNWKNPRMFVLIIFGGLTASVEHLLIFSVNQQTSPIALSLMGFFFGVFIYGPVAIGGIIAIEGVPRDKEGLSFGIHTIYANLAMLLAGYPLSHLGLTFGWKIPFVISYMGICTSTALVVMLRHLSTPIYDLAISMNYQDDLSAL